MKNRDDKIIKKLYETEEDKSLKRFKFFLVLIAVLLLFCVVITGCGTYCFDFTFEKEEAAADTTVCEEVLVEDEKEDEQIHS